MNVFEKDLENRSLLLLMNPYAVQHSFSQSKLHTQGEENVGTYNKTPQSYRKWCKICGGHIFTEHPGLGLTDVYAAVIPDVAFIPGLHVNYGETKLHIRDDLLKLKDFPKGFGGSGIELPE